MPSQNEKCESLQGEISACIEQLRIDVDQNTNALIQYERKLQNHLRDLNERSDKRTLSKFLRFMATAPARVLRRLNRGLRLWLQSGLVRIRNSTWHLPRALVGDIIRLEDALGRRMNLPYQYFKQWQVFKTYMAHIFRGLPGEYQVNRDQYVLSIGNKTRLDTANVRNQLLRPGDHAYMSIISTLPYVTTKEQKCPRCGIAYLMQNMSSAGVKVTCNSCAQVFQICSPFIQQHIRPSDGDRNRLSMIAQKTSQPTPPNTYRAWRGSLEDQESHKHQLATTNSNPTEQYHDQQNFGVSLLKHIAINFSSHPIDIANAIEDLLDHLITISRDPRIANDTNTQRLRTALTHIRNESLQTTELNYLDFRDEHKDFMAISHDTITYLSQRIRSELANKPITLTQNQTTTFSHWVFQHYTLDLLNNNSSILTSSKNTILILTQNLTGRHRSYRISPTTTIFQLKNLITVRERISPSQQYLVYNGRKLEEWYTAAHYELGPKFYVHVLLSIWKDNSNTAKERSARSEWPV